MTSLSETSILSGSSGVTSGYEIDQSIRFNDDDSPYLYKAYSGAGSKQTFTSSFWLKVGNITSARRGLISFVQDVPLELYSADNLRVFLFGAERLVTNRKLRDPHAWYHIVLRVDSTQAVEEDRIRLYINGVIETDFSAESYPSQNANGNMWGSNLLQFGRTYGSSYYFDGYLAEIHYSDGYSYGPENFGEFKEDTDIWIPKEFEGSYGTNGVYLKGEDSSAFGNDSSGNDNDFGNVFGLTASDQVLDSPTNNFCTLSPLARLMNSGTTLSNGNLKVVLSGNDVFHSSFPITEKTYCEVRLDATSNYGGALGFGTFGGSDDDDNAIAFSMNYLSGRINLGNGGSGGDVGGTVSAGDIIMMALDPDTRKWWVGVDGTWRNSGDPGAGSGEVYQWAADYFSHGTYSDYDGIGALVWGGFKGSANGMTVTWNFGQDSTFGGQETAGSNSDGSGNGSFKYAVPSGFKTLCSKSMGS